ncbi:MAG TPA: CHASE domain-containing protein [Rhodocyclaceae bacterium]|nr:CHASE domain-containing protein [Rhodocyclaceae bacterium]
MDDFRHGPTAPVRRVGSREHNWRKELPLPARLATLFAWATLIGCLFLTALTWHGANRDIQRETRTRFEDRVDEIVSAIQARMQAQEQVLLGARGLFDASGEVSREEWRRYVAALQLARNYPGIRGLGFAQYLLPEQLKGHIRQVRAEGFPDYDVRPPGARKEYTAIVFIEPFDWRNLRAFGFDMFTEPIRRAAMEAARDTGNAALSGKVVLVQETEKDIQSGFLMYLPVYRHGQPANTPEQRRKALQGYVYSPFRANDLMAGILGSSLPDVALRIYDGNDTGEADLMYDSHDTGNPPTAPRLSEVRHIAVAGRPWTVRVDALPAFTSGTSYGRPRIILTTGTVISLLLFMVVWSLATLRRRATVLAEDMTAALRESREQLRAAAETANEAIISADGEGRITYFNRAAEALFGYRRPEIIGQPLGILVPERLRDAHENGFRRFLATGKPHIIGRTVALEGRRRDGSEFPIEISLADWATGEGVFFTAILRDIGERREAERRIGQLNAELRRQVEQLAEVNRELESFSYSVSHDLRAPLRAINGFARLLAEEHGGRMDPEGRRLLEVILDSSVRMGHLIDDLLAFARLGQAPITRSSVDMAKLAREVIEEVCQTGDCTQDTFTVGDLPPAQGDKALLRQVWMNLIANAVKFSRPRPQPLVEIGCISEDSEQRYFVRDNGVGFDRAQATQLFGVFKRFHKAERFPGTGVGLAIVHRIVTKHGGRVWAESRVDQGATFYFALPVEEGD